MESKLKISTNHTMHDDKATQEIHINLQGGSPFFAYIWIDDNLYSLIKTTRSIKLKQIKK